MGSVAKPIKRAEFRVGKRDVRLLEIAGKFGVVSHAPRQERLKYTDNCNGVSRLKALETDFAAAVLMFIDQCAKVIDGDAAKYDRVNKPGSFTAQASVV